MTKHEIFRPLSCIIGLRYHKFACMMGQIMFKTDMIVFVLYDAGVGWS